MTAAAILSTVALAVPATSQPAPGDVPGNLVGGASSTCFWNYGAFGADPNFNNAYPDAGATYWAAYIRRPAGSTLSLTGTYPNARYFSFISYDRVGQPIDGVADYQIAPDPGSSNPFQPGARRDGPDAASTYTLDVDHAQNFDSATKQPLFTVRDPRNNEPERNNLLTVPTAAAQGGTGISLGTEIGSDGVTYELEQYLYRVYVPDNNGTITGNVPMPEPVLTLANGDRLTGQSVCDATDSESKDLKKTTGNADAIRLPDPTALNLDRKTYDALRHPETLAPGQQVQVFPAPGQPGKPLFQIGRPVENPATFPAEYNPGAERTVDWRGQYDRRYLLQMYTGDDAPGASLTPPRTGGGFYPNIHNNYMRAALSREYGQVAVVRGKLATSPKTSNGNPVMETGQVRYTSFCMNESVLTTRVMNCAYDENVPTDSNGDYTIVVSLAGERPVNANEACGNGWVEWSPKGDGGDDSNFGWFQVRNMLPDNNFRQAVQNTSTPGDELAVMGEYLPNVEYMSTEEFEKLGCSANGSIGLGSSGFGSSN
ncbi:hypothetical protein [Rhodococcus sp. OK302]|uniref:hypothetical protein n=1 Tax=Rhodococcus sp. OK302 TaxID=1882769 RepID=UPI000B9410A3|nr:hypothetical protein [Rhodococcus sp. OK302]